MTQQTEQAEDSLINKWMAAAQVKQNIKAKYPQACSFLMHDFSALLKQIQSILQSIDNLKTYPWIEIALKH